MTQAEFDAIRCVTGHMSDLMHAIEPQIAKTQPLGAAYLSITCVQQAIGMMMVGLASTVPSKDD